MGYDENICNETRGAHGVQQSAGRGSSPTVREGSSPLTEPSSTIGLLPRPLANVNKKQQGVSSQRRPDNLAVVPEEVDGKAGKDEKITNTGR